MKIIPLILALGLAVGGFVVPSAPSPLDDGSLGVVAAPAFTGILRPGQVLQISGVITNSTTQAIDAGIATVYVSPAAFSTRTALSHWLSGDEPVTETLLDNPLGTIKIGGLVSGQSWPFSLTIPATALAFLGNNSGVFPLAVQVTSGNVPLQTARSAISWYVDGQVPRVNLAIAMPLDAPPSTIGLLDAAALQVQTAPDGSLYQQLDTALAHTVALGVDPSIVASIRILGTSAPQAATDWLNRLESSPNDTFSLNYADSDQVLLSRSGATQPLIPLTFPVQPALFPSPAPTTSSGNATTGIVGSGLPSPQDLVSLSTTIDGLSWPATPPTTEKDLDFLARGMTTRTLVPSTSIAGDYARTPNVTIGHHQVVISDEEISTLMTAAATAVTDSQWASDAAALTATLAVAAEQSPTSTLVATLGRTSSPNTRMMGSTLNAIDSLPWVTPTRLSTAISLDPVPATLATPTPATEREPLVRELLSSEQELNQFSSVANDSTLITGPQRLSLLALLSASWQDNPSGWQAAVQAHLTKNDSVLSSVSIPEGSSINLLQEKENLPITVRNELDVPVTVYVTVRPNRAILDVINTRVELTVEANSQSKAYVPVQSIANGEVRTTVSLSSKTGVVISTPTIVVLNVLAGWETTATVVLTIVLVLLFAAGIVRTILRRRRLRVEHSDDKESAP